MAQKRVPVRSIKEILRLHFAEKLGLRGIGTAVDRSPSVVHDCLGRFKASGLSWPLSESLDEDELERLLYSPLPQVEPAQVMPDFEYVHKELSRKRVRFPAWGHAASSSLVRRCQTPLNRSARRRAIWAAPSSDHRIPCNFSRAPVT